MLATGIPLTRPIITESPAGRSSRTSRRRHRRAKRGGPPMSTLGGRSTQKRRGTAKVVRPQVKLLDAAGVGEDPGTDHAVTIGFQSARSSRCATARTWRRARCWRIPMEGQKTRDITGGLPRAAGSSRSPQPEGRRHAGRDHRHHQLRQGDEGQGAPADHRPRRQRCTRSWCPRRRSILVHEGQVVNRGELIVDGAGGPG